MKTLSLRMDKHHENSLAIAEHLERHPCVLRVNHPGLKSHPQHKLATAQCSGHSGILSFTIKGGLDEANKLLASLKLFTLAVSLGGVESLAALPKRMTHDMVTDEKRLKMGVTDNLVRLSVGVEHVTDLIDDLEQAFKIVYG